MKAYIFSRKRSANLQKRLRNDVSYIKISPSVKNQLDPEKNDNRPKKPYTPFLQESLQKTFLTKDEKVENASKHLPLLVFVLVMPVKNEQEIKVKEASKATLLFGVRELSVILIEYHCNWLVSVSFD